MKSIKPFIKRYQNVRKLWTPPYNIFPQNIALDVKTAQYVQ